MKIASSFASVLAILLLSSGCAPLAHLDEALRLQEYSREREGIESDVAARDADFDRMLERVRAGEDPASRGGAQALMRAFGRPVVVLPRRDGTGEDWIYRRTSPFSADPKITVWVSPEGLVRDVRVTDAP